MSPHIPPRDAIAVIAGMPRSGTTFLYHNLQKHPAVFVPYRKELEFFSYYHDKGPEWFLDHYRDMAPGQVGFDIAPKYFWLYPVIERLKAFNPDIRVILGVRDPVELALSWYAQYSTFNLSMPPFEDFVRHYTLTRLGREIHVSLADGHIPRMLDAYREAFGDNLLLYDYRLFRKNPLAVMQAIESFAGLDPWFSGDNFDNIVINASGRKNIKLLSWILSREYVITTIRTVFPERLIRQVKNRFDAMSTRPAKRETSFPPPERIESAERLLGDQRGKVLGCMDASGLMLGSGKPFAPGR